MWDQWFVRLKNECIEIMLTMKRMILNPLMMILYCLWIVISFQEENYIKKAKKLAEEDRNNIDHRIPNEFIQGTALTAETCPPSLAVRSALRLQFWIFYWKLERERIHLSRTLPSTLTEVGQIVPYTANIIPVYTQNINLLIDNSLNISPISLRSLIKKGRYLVVNFASLNTFLKLAQYHQNVDSPIDFIIIYIKEAHASDGWKFDGENYSFVANHRNIEDRIDAVRSLIEVSKISKEDNISIYCDTIDDHTNHLFRGWPERLYVLYNDQIFYQGGNGPSGYSIPSLQFFLKTNLIPKD